MTAYALRILALSNEASEPELESFNLQAELVQGLAAHADACGPYGLSAWAQPRGHRLYFVDNCWVRARVCGADLPAFFSDVLKGQASPIASIAPEREYLIEAEEF